MVRNSSVSARNSGTVRPTAMSVRTDAEAIEIEQPSPCQASPGDAVGAGFEPQADRDLVAARGVPLEVRGIRVGHRTVAVTRLRVVEDDLLVQAVEGVHAVAPK